MYLQCVAMTGGLGMGDICNAYVDGAMWAMNMVNQLVGQLADALGKK